MCRPTTPTRAFCFLLALAVLELAGMAIFVYSFFPFKATVPGAARWADAPMPLLDARAGIDATHPAGGGANPRVDAPVFDRTIIMLVDALRADMLYGPNSRFTFTRSVIDAGDAVPFVARALPPTVTLPRIKALLTGSPANFLDVLFNFNSAALREDNLISQFKANGLGTVFYGDDTWLRLFPDHFLRQDGTTSFFVKDTVEVDNNVTRHISEELRRDDWRALVLHYLGLDHIGHLEGPRSPLMPVKQEEMDGIIRMIFHEISRQDEETGKRTLLVLCSDHGMTETGNHGGSSPDEVSTALLLLSSAYAKGRGVPLAEMRTVKQLDFAPTMALLMGVPLPNNNVGTVMADAFRGQPGDVMLRKYQLNADSHIQIIKQQFGGASLDELAAGSAHEIIALYREVTESHRAWTRGEKSVEEVERGYDKFLKESSEYCTELFTRCHVNGLYVGMVVSIACAGLYVWFMLTPQTAVLWPNGSGVHGQLRWFYIAAIIAYALSLGSSSFVEEEHQTWYYFTTTAHVIVVVLCWDRGARRALVASCVLLFVARLVRAVNQTGIKWRGEPDLATWLHAAGHGPILALLNLASIVSLAVTGVVHVHRHWPCYGRSLSRVIQALIITAAVCCAGHRTSIPAWLGTESETWALTVYACVLVLWAVTLVGPYWALRFSPSSSSAATSSSTSSRRDSVAGSPARHQPGCTRAGIMAAEACVCLEPPVGPEALGWVQQQLINWSEGILNFSRRSSRERPELSEVLYVVMTLLLLGMTLLLALIHKPHNVLLLGLFALQSLLFIKGYVRSGAGVIWGEMVALMWMGRAAWFALGNSNSFSTLDISGAYTGFRTYNQVGVGILAVLVMATGPLIFFYTLMIALGRHHTPGPNTEASYIAACAAVVSVMAGMRIARVLVFTGIMLALRDHLFVWTVFAPKYLYEAANAALELAVSVLVMGWTVYVRFLSGLLSARKLRVN